MRYSASQTQDFCLKDFQINPAMAMANLVQIISIMAGNIVSKRAEQGDKVGDISIEYINILDKGSNPNGNYFSVKIMEADEPFSLTKKP